jgi:hypothetical protein
VKFCVNLEPDPECTVGRPPRWWERFVPGFAWRFYYQFEADLEVYRIGCKYRDLYRAGGEGRNISFFWFRHTDQMSEKQRADLMLAWRRILDQDESNTLAIEMDSVAVVHDPDCEANHATH